MPKHTLPEKDKVNTGRINLLIPLCLKSNKVSYIESGRIVQIKLWSL